MMPASMSAAPATPPSLFSQWRTLLAADARSVLRDPLLVWCLILSLGVFLPMIRFLPPALDQWLVANHQFTLVPYLALIQSTTLLIAPVLIGLVGGMLILDQRDDGVMQALAITPLGVDGYLSYRVALPGLVAWIVTMIMLGLAGLHPISPLAVILASLCAAPLAPLLALAIALLADNKIQGFAIAKANGLVTAPVVASWFFEPPTQWLFAILPTYLPVKTCWQAMADQPWLWLVPVSLLSHAILIRWMLRRLRRRPV